MATMGSGVQHWQSKNDGNQALFVLGGRHGSASTSSPESPPTSPRVLVTLNPELLSLLAGGDLNNQVEHVYSAISSHCTAVVRLLEVALGHHVRFTWFKSLTSKLHYCHVDIRLGQEAPYGIPESILQQDCDPEVDCCGNVLLLQPRNRSSNNSTSPRALQSTGWSASVPFQVDTRFATVGYSRDEVVQTAVFYAMAGTMWREDLPAWSLSAKTLYDMRGLARHSASTPLIISRDDSRAVAALLDLVCDFRPQLARQRGSRRTTTSSDA